MYLPVSGHTFSRVLQLAGGLGGRGTCREGRPARRALLVRDQHDHGGIGDRRTAAGSIRESEAGASVSARRL